MAVSFKSDKDYGYALLPLFGVSKDLIAKCKAAGVIVDQSSPGTFVVKDMHTTYGTVPVKGSAISLAKSGTLGPASKQALCFQFESAMNKALAANLTDTEAEQVMATDIEKVLKSALAPKFKKPISGLDVSSAKFGQSAKFTASTGSLLSKDNPVSLYKATAAYQPVHGTTGGSVYFVLAIMKGMNIACRVQGSKLSLRAEGPDLKAYEAVLDDFGMDMKQGYASGHYDVSSTSLFYKAFGALVGSIGLHNIVDVANFQSLVKGQ